MADLLAQDDMMFNNFEPKTKNRYVFYVDGIPSFLVKGAKRPSIESNEIPLDHINVQRKIKGKTTWGDVELTLFDPVVPSAAAAVMEWIRLGHESVTGRDGYSDFYKKDCSIVILGPSGDEVEEWTLKGAWIKATDFGDLAWSSDEPQEISVTLSIDYAILQY